MIINHHFDHIPIFVESTISRQKLAAKFCEQEKYLRRCRRRTPLDDQLGRDRIAT